MQMTFSLRRWLRLPGRAALILGLGALSGAAARADTPDQAHRTGLGDRQIRSEGGKIYFSEGGQEAELRVGTAPQRDHLLRLLEEHGPAGVKLDPDPRLLMSSGGGSGFFWWHTKTPVTNNPASAPQNPPQVTPPSSLPDRGLAPPGQNPSADKKG
jgi:hypothetical protein